MTTWNSLNKKILIYSGSVLFEVSSFVGNPVPLSEQNKTKRTGIFSNGRYNELVRTGIFRNGRFI